MESQNTQPHETKAKTFSIKMPKRETLAVLAVLAVVFLIAYQIRLEGYYSPDGNTRWPYLRNIDSYSFFAKIEEIVDNNGVLPARDELSLAPFGTDRGSGGYEFYEHLSARTYMALFSGSQTLQQFMSWFPAFLGALVVVPMYFLGKVLYDRKAGVFAAAFMSLAPSVVTRSLAGDPDSDAIVTLLSMASLAAFMMAYRYMRKDKLLTKRNITYPILAGVVLGLFAITWPGYWFVFLLVAGFVFIRAFLVTSYSAVSGRGLRNAWRTERFTLLAIALFLAGFWAVAVPAHGTQFFADPIAQLVSLSGIGGGESGIKSEAGSFPNVYVSVAELQVGGGVRDVVIRAAGVDTAAQVTGISQELLLLISPFVLTLASFVYLAFSYYKRREHLDGMLMLGLWFFGMLYSSTVAVRFSIFLTPVFAVGSAIILAKMWRYAFKEDRSIEV